MRELETAIAILLHIHELYMDRKIQINDYANAIIALGPWIKYVYERAMGDL